MAVARNSNRLLFDRILSLDDPRLLDCAVFVTIAALFSLMLISNFGLYGCDDIDTVVRPSPSARYEYWALYDGRYLLFAALRFAFFGLLALLGFRVHGNAKPHTAPRVLRYRWPATIVGEAILAGAFFWVCIGPLSAAAALNDGVQPDGSVSYLRSF